MRSILAASRGLVALALASNIAGAQVPYPAADFARLAGTWELDRSANPSLPAERRVITLSPEAMRVEMQRAEDTRPPLIDYRFDGQEVTNAFGTGNKATSRLLREGGAYVTETIYEIRSSPITVRETLNVNSDGSELTVNTTVRVEHGYQGAPPPSEAKVPNVSTARSVFRRQR